MTTRELLEKYASSPNAFYNEDFRRFVLYCIDRLPPHFWTKPASSSGKYHPPDERGEGGLSLHTWRVCRAADVLINAKHTAVDPQAIRLAALLHDAGRYGLAEKSEEYSTHNHAKTGYEFLMECSDACKLWVGNGDIVHTAGNAILSHMGRWGVDRPKSEEDWIVHLADMIASQYY